MGINNFDESLQRKKKKNYQSFNTARYVGKPEWGRGSKKSTPVINLELDMP